MRPLLCCLALMVAGSFAVATSVPELIKKLQSSDNEIRRAAAKELGELGKKAAPAVKALIKALDDSDRFVRRFAAQALGNIGPQAKEAVPRLAALLEEDQPQVREAAVRALAQMGSTGVPALSKALLNAPSDVQERAIDILGKAGSEALPALIAFVGNNNFEATLRQKALEVVVSQGKQAHAAVPVLTTTIKTRDTNRLLRLDAIDALGKLAQVSDKASLTALQEIADDEKSMDIQMKDRARAAIKAIQARK